MTVPNRVRYLSGQTLDLSTLVDEQAYLNDRRKRHVLGFHGAGVVHGLTLRAGPGERVEVAPGEGIDGAGRTVKLVHPLRFSVSGGDGAKDVWVGPDDTWTVRALTIPLPGGESEAPIPPAGGEVIRDDVVYLGRVLPGSSESGTEPTLDTRWRRYTGVGAQALNDPKGKAHFHLGDNHAAQQTGAVIKIEGETSLQFGPTGTVSMAGDLNVAGGKTLRLGAFAVCSGHPPSPDAEPEANPWSIGLAPVEDGEEKKAEEAGGAEKQAAVPSRLEIELPAPPRAGEVKRPSRVSIGVSENGAFTSRLDIAADGKVTVHGNLRVDGAIISAAAPVDPKDPVVVAAMANAWADGTNAVDPDSGLRLSINKLTVNSVRKTIEAKVVVANAGKGKVSSVFAYRAVSAAGLVRQNRIWPNEPPAGFPDRGGRLGKGAEQQIEDSVEFASAEWPADRTIQFVVQATFVDDTGKVGQASTAASATVPATPAPQST